MMIIATIIFGIAFILNVALVLGDIDTGFSLLGSAGAIICGISFIVLLFNGCTAGWSKEARDAHYIQERTELVEELKAAKDSEYMKYLLAQKIEKFNKAHEDDVKLIIDFDAVLKGESE